MKKLLTILIRHHSSTWWMVSTAEGDPPSEREQLYTWTALLSAIRHKLQRKEPEHEDHS